MNFLFGLLLLAASYLVQGLLTKKPTPPKPAALQDFQFPQADEGTPRVVVFGDAWISDWTVLWYGNLRINAIKIKGAKK